MAVEYYKDIDLSFDKTSTGDFPKLVNINAIRASIYNQLFIRDRENYLEDNFGFSIQDLLLNFGDDYTILALESIINNVLVNDNRIGEVDDINITFIPESNEIVCTMRVKLANTIEPEDIELILKKTR